jgi:hypothetical protein
VHLQNYREKEKKRRNVRKKEETRETGKYARA